MNKDLATMVEEVRAELVELEHRKVELEGRLTQLCSAQAEELHAQDVAEGRTNACSGERTFGLGPIHWRSDGTCSYCGSMTVASAIALLKTPGTSYSGADWKYAWPHKFYIGSRKFYNKHLHDATEEEFAEFNELSKELFGVAWELDQGCLGYRASTVGLQMSGVVGKKEGEHAKEV